MAEYYTETENESNGIYTFICEGIVYGHEIKTTSSVNVGSILDSAKKYISTYNKSVEENIALLSALLAKVNEAKGLGKRSAIKSFYQREKFELENLQKNEKTNG